MLGRRFLLADTMDSDAENPRILAFVSDFGAKLLKDHNDWSLDSTFYASPAPYDSLLTINVFFGKESVPAAYVLLPNRREDTLTRALDAVFENELLHDAEPESYITGEQ